MKRTTDSQHGFFGKLSARIEKRRNKIDRQLELRRLRRLRHSTTPPYRHCKNCGTELNGTYCHYCGQYAHDSKQSFWSFLKFYFTETYLIDPKIGPTLVELIRRPGFLTQAFWEGKINSYTNPLRLNMFLLIFSIFILIFSTENFVKSEDTNERASTQLTAQTLSITLKMLEIYANYETLTLVENSPKCEVTLVAPLSTIKNYSDILPIKDETSCIVSTDLDTILVEIPTYLIDEQFVTETPNGEYVFTERENFFNNDAKFEKSKNLLSKIFPIAILLFIPFITIGIKLFNNSPNLTYTHHFTFALHFVAFLQITQCINGLLQLLPHDYATRVIIEGIIEYLIPISYLTLAYRRVYHSRWSKSIINAIMTLITYEFLIAMALEIIIIVASI